MAKHQCEAYGGAVASVSQASKSKIQLRQYGFWVGVTGMLLNCGFNCCCND